MNVLVTRKNKIMIPALTEPELIFPSVNGATEHCLLPGCVAQRGECTNITDGKVLQLSPTKTKTHVTTLT